MERGLSLEDAYRKWSDDLVRYASALVGPADAPDLVGDVFAGLLARDDAGWHDVRDPRAYLFRSVTNQARMAQRSTSRRRARETRWTGQATTAELLVDPAVARTLDRLSVRQRAAIFLTYWEDLPLGEVAERLGTSEGSVKRHLARGRAALREVLG